MKLSSNHDLFWISVVAVAYVIVLIIDTHYWSVP